MSVEKIKPQTEHGAEAKKPKRNTDLLGKSFIFPPHVIDDIHIKAELGRYRMRGMSLFKKIPHWDDLTFLPGTLTRFGGSGDAAAGIVPCSACVRHWSSRRTSAAPVVAALSHPTSIIPHAIRVGTPSGSCPIDRARSTNRRTFSRWRATSRECRITHGRSVGIASTKGRAFTQWGQVSDQKK